MGESLFIISSIDQILGRGTAEILDPELFWLEVESVWVPLALSLFVLVLSRIEVEDEGDSRQFIDDDDKSDGALSL